MNNCSILYQFVNREINQSHTRGKQVLDVVAMLVLAAPNLLRRRGSALDTPAAHYLTRSRPPELSTPNTLRNHLYRPPSLLSHETSTSFIWTSYQHTSPIPKPADCGPHSAFARHKAKHRTHHQAGHLSPWQHASSSRRSTRSGSQCDVPA